MSGTKEQVLEVAISNPKSVGKILGFWGVFFADTTMVQAANVYIAFIGGCLGLILSSLLIYKNFKEVMKK